MTDLSSTGQCESFTLQCGKGESEIPLVLDSPHSGRCFPKGFQTLANNNDLQTAWDAYVAELWQGVLDVGGSLLEAQFPRVVIDPNRAANDIDPELVADDWPQSWQKTKPSAYSKRGMGLIRRYILPDKPMYATSLTAQEIRWRLDKLYHPYHAALADRLDQMHLKFGAVWHINCHSMKSVGNAMNIDANQGRPDMILGDLDGHSCDTEFTEIIEAKLRQLGYSVARNKPYKGGDIVRRYSDPGRGRQSLQVEINRALYWDEKKFIKTRGFALLQANLTKLSGEVASYIVNEIR